MGADRYDPTRPAMPSAADVARLPEAVRAHALVMLQLSAAAREARLALTELRTMYLAGQNTHPMEIASATCEVWLREHKQAEGAAVYRAQLAENDARPVGERWSPTVLALWARCSIAGQKPAS